MAVITVTANRVVIENDGSGLDTDKPTIREAVGGTLRYYNGPTFDYTTQGTLSLGEIVYVSHVMITRPTLQSDTGTFHERFRYVHFSGRSQTPLRISSQADWYETPWKQSAIITAEST